MSDTRTTCEIDADIAGDVMGWESVNMPISNRRFDSFVGPYDPERGQFIVQNGEVMRRTSSRQWMPWSPSTDVAAAWQVVESRPMGTWAWTFAQEDSGKWYAEIRLGYRTSYSKAVGDFAPTLPLAICLAALQVWKSGRALPGGGEPT